MSNSARFDWAAALARIERAREIIERGGAEDPAVRDRVYRERAERLARPAVAAAGPTGVNPILVFRSSTGRFALPLPAIVEIVVCRDTSPVPGAPPPIRGVAQIRGEVVPVLDLPRRLGLPDTGPGSLLVIARAGAGSFAIPADEVEDIREVKDEDRVPAPGGDAHALWITPDLIAVLNPDWLFQEDLT